MNKYRNKTLYLYKGVIYKKIEDDGDIFYKNATGRILSDEQRLESLFFDSVLECDTYRELMFWVANFKKQYPGVSIKLIRQFPIVLIPESDCFKAYKHKVDFAISIKWEGQINNTVYLIESKGVITKDSMLVLRLLELHYKGISDERYIMVFQKYPEKFPRQFPKELVKSTPLNLSRTLTKYIKPTN